MPLYIYFNDEKINENIPIVKDIEAAYTIFRGNLTDEAAKVIKEIDGAIDAKDNKHFIDRWGALEPWDNLSTGSKAAVVISTSNNIIDTQECGINAIKSIIKNIRNGKILMEYPVYSIPYGDIDVLLHNKRFLEGEKLNEYIREECL